MVTQTRVDNRYKDFFRRLGHLKVTRVRIYKMRSLGLIGYVASFSVNWGARPGTENLSLELPSPEAGTLLGQKTGPWSSRAQQPARSWDRKPVLGPYPSALLRVTLGDM